MKGIIGTISGTTWGNKNLWNIKIQGSEKQYTVWEDDKAVITDEAGDLKRAGDEVEFDEIKTKQENKFLMKPLKSGGKKFFGGKATASSYRIKSPEEIIMNGRTMLASFAKDIVITILNARTTQVAGPVPSPVTAIETDIRVAGEAWLRLCQDAFVTAGVEKKENDTNKGSE